MNTRLGRLALAMMIAHAVPQVLAAQSFHDTVTVQAGALRFVRSQVAGHGTIGIDTTARFAFSSAATSETLRPAVVAASIAARLGKGSDFVKCNSPQEYKTCVLNGVDAVAKLTSAYFHADSAYLRLALKEGRNARPQVSEKVYVLRFVKRGAAWEYVRATLRSQS